MLAKITLENFFSFGEKTEIPLNKGVNILVGINGSGKSNLLKAIRLLHEGVAGKGFQKMFLEEFGGFDGVVNASGGKKDFIRLIYEFDGLFLKESMINQIDIEGNAIYEINIRRSGLSSYILNESVKAGKSYSEGKTVVILESGNGKATLTGDEISKDVELIPKDIDYSNGNELAVRQFLFHPTSILNAIKMAISNICTYQQFNTSPQSILRNPVNYGIDERLARDGSNFASLLQRMKNQDALKFDKIIEKLQKVNPQFTSLDFDIIGSKIFVVLREHNLAKTITIEHISDGTLSFLLMSAIFGNPNRGGLVTLDEPENDLHPDMISLVADYMKEAAKTTQIIAATHSPLLLNNFDLEDVLVFEKNDNNETIVKNYTEEDFEGEENILVGQFWLRGLIGGKRW